MKYNNLTTTIKYVIFSVKSTLTALLFMSFALNAQSVHVSNSREIGIYTGNVVWGLTNYYLSQQAPRQTPKFEITGLDKFHQTNNKPQIKLASDISFWTCAVVSGLATLNPESQSIDWRYANLLLQNTLLTANLTQTVKVLVGRERPSQWNANDDFHSFFSGHSSLTASAAASSLWYAYNVPNAPKHAKIIGWSAAGISLVTGILRIGAGKHYPSDVIIGWTVGTGVALLNAHLHRPR